MRRYNLLFLFVLVGGCATLTAGSKTGAVAPSPGKEAVDARVKELIARSEVAKSCPSKTADPDKGGIIEVTAAADGKVTSRLIDWKGNPEVGACIVAEANKVALAPLAGPPVGTLWIFGPPFPNPTEPSDALKSRMRDFKDKMNDEVTACATTFLPPEFPAGIMLQFNVMPGGQILAVNVIGSSAKDGDFDSCAQKAIAKMTAPDMEYAGPYPMPPQSFRVGLIERR